MKPPQTLDEAIERGSYYGRNFASKVPSMEGDDGAQEGALLAWVWWTEHREKVDLWTFVKRRLSELVRRRTVVTCEPLPTDPEEWGPGLWPPGEELATPVIVFTPSRELRKELRELHRRQHAARQREQRAQQRRLMREW